MSEEERLLKEAKRLPYEARLFHKNWKVRADANIDLASVLNSITDPTDPRLREFGPLFQKSVADSNAPVQEKALDALIAFLSVADADSRRYAKEVCAAVAVKCLTGRPKIIEKSQAVFLLWVELEATDVFLDAMERAIKNKVSKVVVIAIDVMFQALSEFGANIVPPKRLMKILPELFDHQDQNVRASAKGLTLELCRWIGQAPIKSILFQNMRDTMKKDLEAELVNVCGTARPSRKIRSEQTRELEEGQTPETMGPDSSQASPDTPMVDEYELVDPMDILTPLEKSGFWKGVKSAKWSERKEAISELTNLSSTKRISPGDFTEVSRTLKKLIMDVNVAVAIEAVQAIKNLASGLRNNFSGSSRFLLPVLLEKLKEKKPLLTDSLTQTLKTMHQGGCLTIIDIIEDVKTAVKNKAPVVRALTLNWVTFCIETSKKAIILKSFKDYVPICIECLGDGTPEVRDASFSTLAAIAKVIGMKNLERSLEKLDEVKKKKLAELIGSSGSGALAGAPGSTEIGKLLPVEADTGASVKKSAASMLGGKKHCQSTVVTRNDRGSVKPEKSKKRPIEEHAKSLRAVEAEELEPADMSLEDIESGLASILQPNTISGLKSSAWRDRLEAICSLRQQVVAIEKLEPVTEMLIRLLCAVPGWHENNHQILQQVFEIVTYIASAVTPFPKRYVVLCLQGLIEKLAEVRTRPHALKCLTTFSEAVGPRFIFERLYAYLEVHKNPKVLSEGILWMGSAVEDFGISFLDLKELINFCKRVGFQSTAVVSRNATVKLTGALHKFVGPDIKDFLQDVKPTLLSTIELEFKRSPFEGASGVMKRTARDPSAVPSMQLNGVSGGDITEKDTTSLLKNMRSPDMKVTKNKKELQASLGLVSKQLKLQRTHRELSNSAKEISKIPSSKSSSNNAKHSTQSKVKGDHMVKPGKRTVHSRVILAKGSMPLARSRSEGTSSFQSASTNTLDLFNIKNSKKEYRLRLVVQKFRFQEPGAEQIRGVEIDLKCFFIRDLHELLLSADSKKQNCGLEILQKAVASKQTEVIEVLDILLRWFVLQFCKSNAACLLKALEFLFDLFDMLKARCFTLSDPEVAIILPFFIEKLGHNTDRVQKRVWNLMEHISFIYYPEKMFPYIVEGLKSKINKRQMVCVEFVEFLLDNHKSQIGGQLKYLKNISTLILEKDAEIRRASLSTMATAYKYFGEDIWKYVGKLSATEKNLLNEKFKLKAQEMETKKEGKPGEARAGLKDSGNVVHELVKMQGSEIKGHLSHIYINTEHQPLILAEINCNHQNSDGVSSPVDQNSHCGSDVYSTKSC